ncbi:MAG: hypothetical protein AAGA12_04975 [Pseudomonadota bacterium]
MNVLIVENDQSLGRLWAEHIVRLGLNAEFVQTQAAAVTAMQDDKFDVLILNLNLKEGSALAVADYASFKLPKAKAIFVTSNSFFSDGSIFSFMSNACALVPRRTPPDDLAALADYHSR